MHTDTPLVRGIPANSRETTQHLLEHGSRVDKLPALLGVPSLRGPTDPVDERVKELLGLQEQVFLAGFKRSSRFVDLVMKGLGLYLRFPLVLELMSLYLKFVALNRWDSLSVLQELVQENKTRGYWAAIACDRDALEFFHFGIRKFLSDFDGCIRNGNREENVLRTALLTTGHFAMIDKQEPRPIEYFSRVVAEFFEEYIGSSYEVELFSDVNQACANELFVISESRDFDRLRLFLTSIFQFVQPAQEKGQDRFLNVSSAACLILGQENATAHRWLIGEAIPGELGALIAEGHPGSLQKQACKTLVECLIIGKQYGLTLPKGAPRESDI